MKSVDRNDQKAVMEAMQRIVDEQNKLIATLVQGAPENAVAIVEKSMEIAGAIRYGIHEDRIEKDITEYALFELGKMIFFSNHEGVLVISVPDEVVRRLFEIQGSPDEVRRTFRSQPDICVAVFAFGCTTVAHHYDETKMGKA